MEPIKISDERMEVLLPQEIKDTNALSKNAKKILATLINYFFTLDKAKQQGYILLSNYLLRESACIKTDYLMSSIQELKDYDLIERESGTARENGVNGKASKYIVKWDNLKKPLKKVSFEDLYSAFLNKPETPMGTVVLVLDKDKEKDIVKDTVSVEVKAIEKAKEKEAGLDLEEGTVLGKDLEEEKAKNKAKEKGLALEESTELGRDLKEDDKTAFDNIFMTEKDFPF